MKLPRPIIYIRWRDSAIRPGQHSFDELADLAPVELHSVGWLIEDMPRYVSLALELIPVERSVRDAVCIPVEQILERRIVRK